MQGLPILIWNLSYTGLRSPWLKKIHKRMLYMCLITWNVLYDKSCHWLIKRKIVDWNPIWSMVLKDTCCSHKLTTNDNSNVLDTTYKARFSNVLNVSKTDVYWKEKYKRIEFMHVKVVGKKPSIQNIFKLIYPICHILCLWPCCWIPFCCWACVVLRYAEKTNFLAGYLSLWLISLLYEILYVG